MYRNRHGVLHYQLGASGSMSRTSGAMELGPPPPHRRDVSRRSRLSGPRSTMATKRAAVSHRVTGARAGGGRTTTAGNTDNTTTLPTTTRQGPVCGAVHKHAYMRGRRGWVAFAPPACKEVLNRCLSGSRERCHCCRCAALRLPPLQLSRGTHSQRELDVCSNF